MAFGLPAFAFASPLFFVQFFFLKFSTDVLLLSPALVGTIFALGRLWDAVSDPLVGTWSDRTRTRLGRRRPWMFAAVPALGLTFIAVYSPPSDLTDTGLIVWVTVALFGFYTALTAYLVPHHALGSELSTDHHARSRLFAFRHVGFTLGIMSAFGLTQLVNNAEDPRATAASLVMIGAVVFGAILLVPPIALGERPDYQGRGADSPFRAMADVLKNPHARLLLAVVFIDMIGAGVLGILSPFFFEYVLQRPDLIAPLPAVYVAISIISIPFWIRVSRRFGKRNVWVVALLVSAVSFGCVGFVQVGQVAPMVVVLIFAGFGAGCGGMIGPSILADVMDYDEYKSGERKEGAYSAAWGFMIKSANALIIFLTGWVLQLAGFEPNVEQSPQAELALRGLYAGLPLTMFTLGAFILTRFQLNEKEHAKVRAAIEGRRETS